MPAVSTPRKPKRRKLPTPGYSVVFENPPAPKTSKSSASQRGYYAALGKMLQERPEEWARIVYPQGTKVDKPSMNGRRISASIMLNKHYPAFKFQTKVVQLPNSHWAVFVRCTGLKGLTV